MRNFDLIFDDEFENSRKIDETISEYLKTGDSESLFNYLKSENVSWFDFDGYMIVIAISNFIDGNEEALKKYIDIIRKQEDVKDVRIEIDKESNVPSFIIGRDDVTIKVQCLFKLEPKIKRIVPKIESEEYRAGKCFEINSDICNHLGNNLDFVIGYTYGYCDKSRYLHSWIEGNQKGERVVISGRFNAVINLEGFYALRHAEVINRISSKDMKNDFKNYLTKLTGIDKDGIADVMYYAFRDEMIEEFKKNEDVFNNYNKK